MENITMLILGLGSFAMVFGIVYISVITSHRSKMAMIEAGMDPRDDDGNGSINKDKVLRNAILLVMVPLGILVGRVVAPSFNLELEQGGLVFAFLFGGLGLGLFYFIQNKREGAQ